MLRRQAAVTRAPLPAVAGRAWGLPLVAHAAALVLLLAAAAPFLRLGDSYTSDEGAYAIQARDVADGHWETAYAAAPYDPDGRWFPLANANHSRRGWFAYVEHPAYPLLLSVAARAGGAVVGLHLPALAGSVGVAVAAWLLAAEVGGGRSTRRAAFWVAAAGPALVHAYLLWAHSLSAAVGGLAVVAAARLCRRPGWAAAAALAAASAAGVLLRAEGLLLAVSTAVALAAVGLRGRPWVLRAGAPAAAAGAAVLAAAVEHRWKGAILGQAAVLRGARDRDMTSGPGGGGALDWLRGRAEGAAATVLHGADTDRLAAAVVAAGLVLLVFAAWAWRRRRPGWENAVTAAVAAGAALYVVRIVLTRSEPMSGILAAWPLALLGLAALPTRLERGARMVVCLTALYGAAVLATQYRAGGGLEWGGRFLSPVQAPVAVLACLGLGALVRSLAGRSRAVVAVSLAILFAAPAVTGLALVRDYRGPVGRQVDELLATHAGDLVVTNSIALPRLAWRAYPRLGWMYATSENIGELTAGLRAAGVRRLTLYLAPGGKPPALDAFPSVVDATGPAARGRGWRTLDLSAP